MKLPNLKQFVQAVLKPGLWAIKMQYDYKVKDMYDLTNRQTQHITELESSIAQTNETLADLSARQVDYNATVEFLRTNLYTSEEVKELERRSRELNHICSALYDKVHELVNNGFVTDPYLPPFTGTWIPGDYVLTDAELQAVWRRQQGLLPDDLLTPTQDAALVKYILDYRKRRPGIPGSGTGGPDEIHRNPDASLPDSPEDGKDPEEGGDSSPDTEEPIKPTPPEEVPEKKE